MYSFEIVESHIHSGRSSAACHVTSAPFRRHLTSILDSDRLAGIESFDLETGDFGGFRFEWPSRIKAATRASAGVSPIDGPALRSARGWAALAASEGSVVPGFHLNVCRQRHRYMRCSGFAPQDKNEFGSLLVLRLIAFANRSTQGLRFLGSAADQPVGGIAQQPPFRNQLRLPQHSHAGPCSLYPLQDRGIDPLADHPKHCIIRKVWRLLLAILNASLAQTWPDNL